MNLYVINNTNWDLPEDFMHWLFERIYRELKSMHLDVDALKKELGVVFVDDEDMQGLNTNYRGKHYVTDVLSFPMDGEVLGEIIMCPNVIVKQAEEHELHESEELGYLFLHGILHLLGFDHEKDVAGAEEMFAIQDKVFEILQAEDIVEKFKQYKPA